MSDTTQFSIGADVACTDGAAGKVVSVVVDPLAKTVTHLVVEPPHRAGLGRLVPLDLVTGSGDELALSCTEKELAALPPAEETEFLPGTGVFQGYSPGGVLNWPYYGLGGGGLGLGGLGGGLGGGGLGGGMGAGGMPVVVETVPLGEVAVRRGEAVHATDGDIGRVQGLVVDRDTGHVTHVLLQEGHLWGRKEVAIPISAVTDVEAGIGLSLSKKEVGDLPPVEVDHPDW